MIYISFRGMAMKRKVSRAEAIIIMRAAKEFRKNQYNEEAVPSASVLPTPVITVAEEFHTQPITHPPSASLILQVIDFIKKFFINRK